MNYFLASLIILLAFIIASSARWAVNYFGLSSFSQIIYHIKVPLDGTNIEVLYDWIKMCLITSVLFTAVLSLLFYLSNGLNLLVCVIFTLLILLIYASCVTGLPYYLLGQMKTTNIYESMYVDPKNVEIEFKGKKKNLIHIYLESMENTHADESSGGNSKVNLIPELVDLANTNINFSENSLLGGPQQLISTGWTTAGLVASSAGVPINMSIAAKKYSEKTSFMKGLTTLGDILEREGYTQAFLCGSDANFGGRSYYYKKHGNFKIYDLYTARENGDIEKKYKKFWGFEDEKVFEIAKKQLLILSKKEKPFNFTMLTVDTHHPNGYVCNLCEKKHPSNMANILSCQSKQLKHFISWIEKQEFYKDSIIVIQGDHLSMAAKFMNSTYNKDYERTTYNVFLNTGIQDEKSKNRKFCNFDYYPTILSAMGAEISGERLAFGTNLFSDRETIIEEIGLKKFNRELAKRSNYYNRKIL